MLTLLTSAVTGFGHTTVTHYTGTEIPLARGSQAGQQQSPKVPLLNVSSSPALPGAELRGRVEVGVSEQVSCSSPFPCPALPLPSWGLFEPHPSSPLDLEALETAPAHKGNRWGWYSPGWRQLLGQHVALSMSVHFIRYHVSQGQHSSIILMSYVCTLPSKK